MKDQLDGLDLYVAGKASVNDTFDRYMSTKYNLRESTKSSVDLPDGDYKNEISEIGRAHV